MRTEEEFEVFLRETIAPRLRAIEQERARVQAEREAAKLPPVWKVAAVGIGLVLSYASGALGPLVFCAAVPFIIDLARITRVPDTATPRVHAEILAPVVEFWDPSFQYHPSRAISEEEIAASRLFENVVWNRYAGEDLVIGRHGATAFRFSEVHLKRVKRRGKRTETEQVFRGLVFVADCNKAFRGQTLVTPDRAERALGAVGRALQAVTPGAGLSLVELEDPEFERAFVVRASDPTEARYLLSPSLMRRVLTFHENSGSQLRLSFCRGRVYVAVPLPGDLFAMHFGERIGLERIRAWSGELLFATSIVDELDLNTRIWSKAPAA